MPISRLKRKDNFFATKTKFKAVEIDLEFNKIVDFINNDIISTVNELISNQFIGSDNVNLRNSFLINVGNSTTKWDFLNLDNFAYNGTSLIKFEQGTPNSILAVDNLDNYRFVTPTQNQQVLQSVLNNLPTFNTISGDSFTDRCILANHVALNSIGANNVGDIIYDIADNIIPTVKFANNAVTVNNLEQGNNENGITLNKFTPVIQAIFKDMLTSNMMADNFFRTYYYQIFNLPRNIYNSENKVNYERITGINVFQYPVNKFAAVQNIFIDSFDLSHVALNSIEAKRLQYTEDNLNYLPNVNEFLDEGCIHPEHLDEELKTLFGF